MIQSETQEEEFNNTIREYIIKQIRSNYICSERYTISFIYLFYFNAPLQKSVYVPWVF